MALLAETLVEEWLNRQGFFTIRGIKEGVREIDILGVRPRGNGLVDAQQVEVQVGLRPIGYMTNLTQRLAKKLNKAPGFTFKRTPEMLGECVEAWVKKKFHDPRKVRRRDALWPGAKWEYVLVHGVFKYSEELKLIGALGVRLIPLRAVISDLCEAGRREFTASAGGVLADLIEFFAIPAGVK
jgi:hypothetical protein